MISSLLSYIESMKTLQASQVSQRGYVVITQVQVGEGSKVRQALGGGGGGGGGCVDVILIPDTICNRVSSFMVVTYRNVLYSVLVEVEALESLEMVQAFDLCDHVALQPETLETGVFL